MAGEADTRTSLTRHRLVEQVYAAIFNEVTEGRLAPNTRLIQDELAEAYGVSRQPVQQALLLLRNHGIVRDAPRRGLVVAPLEASFVRNLYEVRGVLEGLTSRLAAERGAARARREGPPLVEAGRAAVASGSVARLIAADIGFHRFLSEISGNPIIVETVAPHLNHLQRVMGEVLREDETMPSRIWEEHAAILDAVMAGDGARADALSQQHIARAATVFVARLRAQEDACAEEVRRRRVRR
ncbi:HTH-type transcriptional regulator LutR [Methylobacterium crusticola]|uniref:HTH-type transcriptional regulator LutR n=1 Tax=Methylobacterium crusticola TaxID=1697972 RepID=A0ABQ4R9A9_9HYPH|nr:GntR family transcriptional regulator [Methylobacterium crusticola]GJD53470.1 HTH-type transcriptional regulator LutR [Methylobacterium crusticola]